MKEKRQKGPRLMPRPPLPVGRWRDLIIFSILLGSSGGHTNLAGWEWKHTAAIRSADPVLCFLPGVLPTLLPCSAACRSQKSHIVQRLGRSLHPYSRLVQESVSIVRGGPLRLRCSSGGDRAVGAPIKRKWRVIAKGGSDKKSVTEGVGWAPGDIIPESTRDCNALLQNLARQGDGKTALLLLKAMDEVARTRDTYTYNAAVNACSRMKNARSVLTDLVADMRKRHVQPNTVTFNTLLKGAASIGDLGWAEELLKEMSDSGVAKDHITFSTFVHTCSLSGNMMRAKETMKEMSKAGIQPTESTLTSFINGCEWTGDLSSAKAAYTLKTGEMSTAVTNAMADCLTACGRPTEALSLLGLNMSMFEREQDIQPCEIASLDSVLINSAMKALRSLKSVEWSLKLIKAASSPEGVHPDFITFNIFTDTCCLSNQKDLARLAIDILYKERPSPTIRGASTSSAVEPSPTSIAGPHSERSYEAFLTNASHTLASAAKWIVPRKPHTHQYSSLIRAVGYTRVPGEGVIDQCVVLLDEMEERGVKVDAIALTTLVDVCAHQGQPDRAVSVIERALEREKSWADGKQRPSRPNVATFNALIKAYREAGQFVEALGVIDRMEKAGVQPDRISYNTLLDAAVQSDKETDPDGVMEMMLEKGVAPDTTTFNTLIKRYIRSKDLSKALQVPQKMRDAGLQPDHYSYGLLAEACGMAGDVMRIMEISERVGQDAPKELQQSFLEAQLKAYAVNRNIQAAENIVAQLKRQGASLTPKGHAALMDAYANCGEPYSVLECMDSMKKSGLELNKVHHSILLKAFCNADILDEALLVLRRDIQDPDAACFNTLISAAMRVGNLDVLVNVLRDMERAGVQPDGNTQRALDQAGSASAMKTVGSILTTFNKRFKDGLATAITGGL